MHYQKALEAIVFMKFEAKMEFTFLYKMPEKTSTSENPKIVSWRHNN
jgi:hypothetical protein